MTNQNANIQRCCTCQHWNSPLWVDGVPADGECQSDSARRRGVGAVTDSAFGCSFWFGPRRLRHQELAERAWAYADARPNEVNEALGLIRELAAALVLERDRRIRVVRAARDVVAAEHRFMVDTGMQWSDDVTEAVKELDALL